MDIMKNTGHADYKSMKPCIDIAEDAKKDAIKNLEASWKKKFNTFWWQKGCIMIANDYICRKKETLWHRQQ